MSEGSLELFREPAQEGAPDAPGPKLLAVAGAKGGVGKSLLTANLGVYLATIGRRVVVVDADQGGATLHAFFGVTHPGGIPSYVPPAPTFHRTEDDLDDFFDFEVEVPIPEPEPEPEPDLEAGPVPLPIPNLRLLHAGIDEPPRGSRRRERRGRLVERLRSLDADFVVIDLGAGTHRSLLDVWLDSDLKVFMTLPEPTAIEGTYRFMRAAFARSLKRGAKDPEQRRRIVAALRELGNTPPPPDLLSTIEAADPDDPWLPIVRAASSAFELPLVVNQTRLRADLELGDGMATASRRRLGLHIDYVGYIDSDDTVWNTLRKGRPLLVESPGTKASRNIEKIARRLLARNAGKRSRPSYPQVPPNSHHDLLEVDRGATDEEIRRAFKRVREIFAPGSLASYGLFESRGFARLSARLDEAHDVLLDPARRRPYELSVFPPTTEEATDVAEDAGEVGPTPPAPVITPETDFTGGLLRAVRESQGVKIKQVSRHTKIGMGFLKAIEDDDFSALPAEVYVRGFVTELAKFLRLDPEHVSRTYIRRLRRWVDEQEKS